MAQGLVVWLALEEHPADVVQRFGLFDADPAEIVVAAQLESPLEELESAAGQLRPVLIVIDTLAALAAELVRDPSSSSAWTKVMSRLARIARDADAAVLVLHHSRKSDGQYRDSSAIGAGCDVMLEMDTPLGATTERRIRGRGRIPVDPKILIRLCENRFELADGSQSLDQEVLAVIAANPGASKREVREKVSRRGAEVDEALEVLLKAGRIVNEGDAGRHSYRVAPDTGADAACPEETPTGQGPGHATGHAAGGACPESETLGAASGHVSPSWTLDLEDE